jgi:outer membrane protein OmpA-like peptidoglycan-associated protein
MSIFKCCILLLSGLIVSGCTELPDVSHQPVPTAFFVFFEKDSVVINADAKPVLDEAAAYLIQYDNTAVRIVGHMSKSEGAADLDQQRASRVAEELAKRGSEPVRMKLMSMGVKESLSGNPSVGDPAVDRRVEILFSTM